MKRKFKRNNHIILLLTILILSLVDATLVDPVYQSTTSIIEVTNIE